MSQRFFPRWAAPPMGAVAGAFYSTQAARRDGEPLAAEHLVIGAICGLIAGGLLCLADTPADPEADGPNASFSRESPILGVVALLAIFVAWFPLTGPVLTAIAVAVTWRSRRWPRVVARVAAGLALASTIGCGILIAVKGR